ncbi:MAG: caspase family protein [Pseudomonadota bacterium]
MRRQTFLSVVLLTVISVFLSAAAPAQAQTNHALIVGVSRYDNLPENAWLTGPANDAVLMRDFLRTNGTRQFDDANITLLADGVEGAQHPTLQAIRDALTQLARDVEPNDFVYLHFSGHGTQAPALVAGSELDGLDELFLPADIGQWQDNGQPVENALVDDELGALIGAVRAKGAHVWAVFDSCHSGTVTRASNLADPADAEVSRQLSPALLGIPQEVLDAAQVRTRGQNNAGGATVGFDGMPEVTEGSFVAFFAAQTNQTTPEMRLPAGDPARQTHGLFTFSILSALAQNPGVSYRQLAQEVLRIYAMDGRANPTPLFEGDLDFGVFATQPGPAVTQWTIKQTGGTLEIPAGQLSGLAPGDTLGLVRTATQEAPEEGVALVVDAVTPLKATLRVESARFLPIEPGFLARQSEVSVDFAFTVALPPAETSAEIAGVLEALTASFDAGGRVGFVPTGAAADTQILYQDDQLWFLGGDGVLTASGPTKTPSILLGGKTEAEVATLAKDTISKMARVRNITALAGVYRPSKLGLKISLNAQSTQRSAPLDIPSSGVAQLTPGDIVFIDVTNTNRDPVDLNVLYIGSDYSISFLYAARINPAEGKVIDLFDVTDGSFGRERILTIATPAAPQTPTQDFSWLEQNALERTRANGMDGFAGLLQGAGFDMENTRGAARRGGAEGGIAQFLVDVVPALN